MINLKKIFPDPLILYLIIALMCAYLLPQLSQIDIKGITLNLVIEIGVIAVFFFYGLKLKWKEVFNDLMHWQLHIRIQLITFLLFPLIGLMMYPITFLGESYYILFLGIFYLCSLPSTVSSSVVMVSMAHGNVTSAIFNASLSGLLGIILTPLWMSLFLDFESSIDSSSMVIELVLKVLLPVVIGAFLQPFLGKLYDKNKTLLSNVDKLTIVLIVYNSFSHAFHSGLFKTIDLKQTFLMALLVVSIFFIVFYSIQWMNKKWWKFSTYNFVTIQFCGTKKSLVHGSVMGSILFTDQVGVYLLPVMIFHTFQLLYISYKASIYAKEMV